jgi:hypothetical protein
LLLVALALLSNGRLRVVDGVIEVHGGLVAFMLRRCVPVKGGVEAMTLGHVVLGRNERALELTRKHERVHVRQCEQWGPIFLPAYFAGALVAILTGKDAYNGNYFERKAVEGETL